jgi:hypothetical protein
MASNVVIVDSEFRTIARELSEGTEEIEDIIKKYKVILEYLSQNGIVDEAINNVLVAKVDKVNSVLKRLVPVINDIYSESIKFVDYVAEKDGLI